jgi:hypothetical protein
LNEESTEEDLRKVKRVKVDSVVVVRVKEERVQEE